MGLEEIIFSSLKEEDVADVKGWQKETVTYVMEHPGKVVRQIRTVARGLRKNNLQKADIDDIYNEILLYLYGCSDYDLNKAMERSSSGTLVSIEGYLSVCIKYCVMRYCKEMSDYEKEVVSETVLDGDDKELSIFNTIADTRSDIDLDYLSYDLSTLCRSCESLRYRYGADLYLIMYVRLLTIEYGIVSKYREILNALDITKQDLARFDSESEDSVVVIMAKAISMSNSKDAIETLEPYVYSRDIIKKAIIGFSK